jgi:hypothetical protein
MSYAADVAPEAMAAFGSVSIETQEAILDLLDRIAAEAPRFRRSQQFHALVVEEAHIRTDVGVEIDINHSLRLVRLMQLGWVTFRI